MYLNIVLYWIKRVVYEVKKILYHSITKPPLHRMDRNEKRIENTSFLSITAALFALFGC